MDIFAKWEAERQQQDLQEAALANWRDDRRPENREEPTAFMVVRCAADPAIVLGNYRMDIIHVLTFPQGKGFMSNFYEFGRSRGTGKVYRSYEEALQSGDGELRSMVAADKKRREDYGLKPGY